MIKEDWPDAWITVLQDDTHFTRCELTDLMSDCLLCEIDSEGRTYSAWINRFDVIRYVNDELEDDEIIETRPKYPPLRLVKS